MRIAPNLLTSLGRPAHDVSKEASQEAQQAQPPCSPVGQLCRVWDGLPVSCCQGA